MHSMEICKNGILGAYSVRVEGFGLGFGGLIRIMQDRGLSGSSE